LTYRVEITFRATRDLDRLYRTIDAARTHAASTWFNGLEAAILSLSEHPARRGTVPEDRTLRQLLYGTNRYVYRVIFRIDETKRLVTVLHVRHGFRQKPKRGGIAAS